MIYHTQGEQANHYATDTVFVSHSTLPQLCLNMIQTAVPTQFAYMYSCICFDLKKMHKFFSPIDIHVYTVDSHCLEFG
jgi:hypothetical protein